jgi:hypothetical protein
MVGSGGVCGDQRRLSVVPLPPRQMRKELPRQIDKRDAALEINLQSLANSI